MMRRLYFAVLLLLSAAAATAAEPLNPRVVERYKQMLAANPVEGTALDRLWKTYSEAGRSGDLVKEYEQDPSFAARMILGHLLRRGGRGEEAIAAYRDAAGADAQSPLPHLGLGRLHAEAGRHREAAEAWERGAALLPAGDARTAEILMEAGSAWLAMGEKEKAASAWERTLAAAPQDATLRERLAESYLENGLIERAIPHLEHLATHAAPKNRAEALQRLARVHQLAGRADEAIRSLERAIALTAPGNWLGEELQDQLIRYYQRLHRVPELEERWKRYAAEHPRDLTAYLQLLALYERLGRLEEARSVLEKLVALVPRDFHYRWRLARLLLRLEDLPAATALYDHLLGMQPGNSDLVFERAEVDVRSQSSAAGADRVERFVAEHPGDESLRARALQFYERHQLAKWTERQLRSDAERGTPEAIRALADFLFARGLEAAGVAELQRLARPGAAPAQQASALLEIAQSLKGHGRLAAALQSVQEAMKRLPAAGTATREALLLAADLHMAQQQTAEARGLLERAAALSTTPSEQMTADQKLFEVLRSTASEAVPESAGLPLPRNERASLPPDLQAFLKQLEANAEAETSESAWLRLARWRSWTRDKSGALQAARKAVELAPASIPAHEAVISLAGADPGSPTVAAHLQKLSVLDPANRASHLQRLARFKLQSGNIRDARVLLESLAREQPGNLDVLQDLAAVHERSHDWQAAAAAWQQIHRQANSNRKREALTPLLRSMEQLGQSQAAAQMVLAEVNAAEDPALQRQLFDELLALCTKHQILPWLAEEWQKRRLRVDDAHYTEVAYSRILKAQGDADAAFQALWDASFSAPDLTESLPGLVREAEERHNFAAAVDLQNRLLRAQVDPSAAGFLKLAQLQERLLALKDLGETWERAVAHFPRDPAVLLPAAEFYRDCGRLEHASELYGRVAEVEPNNGAALLARADVELERDRPEEAAKCLEQLLAHIKSSPEEKGIRLPQADPSEGGRLQSAYLSAVRHRRAAPRVEVMRALQQFWVDRRGAHTSGGELRYRAIQQLGEIVQIVGDPARKAQWQARWRAAADEAPGEALWAFFHGGFPAQALAIVEKEIARDPENAGNQQAFLWLALQTQQWDRLGAWVRRPERTPHERDFLIVTLGQFVRADAFPALEDHALEQLFPPNASSRVWQAAALYATQARFAEAARIGERAFSDNVARDQSFGQELANWHLADGNTEGTLRILRRMASGAAESFDAPVYSALRQIYLLTPPSERAAFVERKQEELSQAENPVHRALALTLLHGLAGDFRAAEKHLDDLASMRPMTAYTQDDTSDAATRAWTFALSVGLQLQAWKLERLTEHYWARVLADPALIALEGASSGGLAKELRVRLFALRAAMATPFEFEQKLADYTLHTSAEELLPLGEALENLGAARQALVVYRRAWEENPQDPQALRNLLNACRAAQDVHATEAVLRVCVEERLFGMNDTLQRDLITQLADLLDHQGKTPEALALVGAAAIGAPFDPRLLQRMVQLQERTGKLQDAEATWRQLMGMDSVNPAFRLGLANLLHKTGRTEEAMRLLEESQEAQAEARLAELYLEQGRVEAALALCYRATPAQAVTLVPRLVPLLLERGEVQQARGVLLFALERVTEPGVALHLRMQLAETFDPRTERALLERELRRVRRHAREHPKHQEGYFAWLQQKAARFEVEAQAARELQEEWRDGAGPISAGIALCLLQSANREQAEKVVEQLLARRDLGVADVDRLNGAFEAAGHHEWLARSQERAVRMNGLDDFRLLAWIRTLQKVRGTAAAREALDRWSPRLWLTEEAAGLGGELYAELGDHSQAEALFQHALRYDAIGRQSRTRLQYSKLKRLQGDLPAARLLLEQAYRNPAERDFSELVEWLVSAGRLQDYEKELPALGLDSRQVVALRQALWRHYERARNAPAAYALLREHPEVFDSGFGESFREFAEATGTHDEAIGFLEGLAVETDGRAGVSSVLARVLFDRAQRIPPADVLPDLQRATDLDPGFLPAVMQLARRYQALGERGKAKSLVERFLATSTDEKERATARALLRELNVANASA